MSVPFIFNGSKLVIVLSGETHTINNSDRVFSKIVEAIKENKDEEHIKSILSSKPDLTEYIKSQNESRVTVVGDTVLLDGKPLHNAITQRVVEFMKLDLPISHLLKFIERIENNPSYNSRQQAYSFLEHQCLVITEEGMVLGYKSIRKDYTDHRTGRIDNSPGVTVTMDRSRIDDNPNNHCSSGLHVGAFEYANTFNGNSRNLVLVEFDPADIVSVPNDFSCQKCRVCKYKVLKDVTGVLESPLYKSNGEPYTVSKEVNWDFCNDNYDDQYNEGEVLSYDDDYDYDDYDDYDDEDDYDYEDEDDDDSYLPPFIEL